MRDGVAAAGSLLLVRTVAETVETARSIPILRPVRLRRARARQEDRCSSRPCRRLTLTAVRYPCSCSNSRSIRDTDNPGNPFATLQTLACTPSRCRKGRRRGRARTAQISTRTWTTRRRANSTRSLRLRLEGRLVRVAVAVAAEVVNEVATGGEAGRGERGREAAAGERGLEFFGASLRGRPFIRVVVSLTYAFTELVLFVSSKGFLFLLEKSIISRGSSLAPEDSKLAKVETRPFSLQASDDGQDYASRRHARPRPDQGASLHPL